MRLGWRETARNGRRRMGLRNAAEVAVAGLGAAIAIGAMEWFSVVSHFPLVIIPFATSIVLVIGSPDAEPAQPRALIGGHVVATLAGLAMLQLTGPQAWAAAAAVGVAIAAMVVTGTFHPPAGIKTPCWQFPITFPGHSCSRPCWPAPCCWPRLLMSGTAGSAAGRGRDAGSNAP